MQQQQLRHRRRSSNDPAPPAYTHAPSYYYKYHLLVNIRNMANVNYDEIPVCMLRETHMGLLPTIFCSLYRAWKPLYREND